MSAATVPVVLEVQPAVVNATPSRFCPLGWHPALQHASLQRKLINMYIFIYVAVLNFRTLGFIEFQYICSAQEVFCLPVNGDKI